jgi:hypothetical protein
MRNGVVWSTLALAASTGFAMGACHGARASEEERVREIAPGPADAPSVVVRERTEGKTAARFTVEPQAIRQGHFVRFEAFAEGPDGRWPRWSCVAYADVGECFGESGVRLPYRERDDRLVLEIDGGPLADLGGTKQVGGGPVAQR